MNRTGNAAVTYSTSSGMSTTTSTMTDSGRRIEVVDPGDEENSVSDQCDDGEFALGIVCETIKD